MLFKNRVVREPCKQRTACTQAIGMHHKTFCNSSNIQYPCFQVTTPLPSSTTSTIEPKLSNLITGIYDYQSSVNFDNYLKQLGVNYVLRKLAALASPTVTIGTNCQDHEKHVSNLKFVKLLIYPSMGGQENRRRKKVFFSKVYTKVECYFKKNWVLVFSFMYLVSVDPMDRSFI